MPTTLVDQLCLILLCEPYELYIRLLEPTIREQAINFLKMVKLKTTHLRFNKSIKFHGLTYTGPRQLPAYRGFLQVNVAQYYYVKHKIILSYMEAPCIIQVPHSGNHGDHIEYYPLEVLCVDQDEKN